MISHLASLFTSLAWSLLIVGVWLVVLNRSRPLTSVTLEGFYFRDAYGLSVSRMLAESPIDREEVRRLRGLSFRGHARAVKYVREREPVPLDVAKQFVNGC